MPRPNAHRNVLAEDHLAQRVAQEREARGMTYEGLAKRMTDAGCSINQSAIYKIEQGQPRRRITVDELVTFSQVFGLNLDELLLPPAIAVNKDLGERFIAWNEARELAAAAKAEADQRWEAVKALVAEHPESSGALERVLTIWADHVFKPEDREAGYAYYLYTLAPSAESEEKWKQMAQSVVDEVAPSRG